MDVITPRVNYGLLSRYKGRKVRLVGRVIQVHILTLKAEESTIAVSKRDTPPPYAYSSFSTS